MMRELQPPFIPSQFILNISFKMIISLPDLPEGDFTEQFHPSSVQVFEPSSCPAPVPLMTHSCICSNVIFLPFGCSSFSVLYPNKKQETSAINPHFLLAVWDRVDLICGLFLMDETSLLELSFPVDIWPSDLSTWSFLSTFCLAVESVLPLVTQNLK